MPTVSVIIPTYNNKATLPTAIESVLNQTYSDLEIIVIDDGSTDRTKEVLQPYVDRIRYFYQENQERSNARNHGIHLAEGTFISFLDADDWLFPNKIEKQVNILLHNDDIGMVYSQAYGVDKNGKRVSILGPPKNKKNPQEFYCQLLMGNQFPIHTPLVRRDILLNAGGFDESLRHGEDWDCWLRVAQITKVGYIPEPLACYRIPKSDELIKRIAQRGGVDAPDKIIQKAIKRGGCPQEVFDHALALAHFQSALFEIGLGQVEYAKSRLESIQRQYPGFLIQYQGDLIYRAADLATKLCLGESNVQEGMTFLKNFWNSLPKGIYSHGTQNKIYAQLYAVRFFQAYQVGNLHQVLQSLLPMLINDPTWIRNRGVWSVLFQSLFRIPPLEKYPII